MKKPNNNESSKPNYRNKKGRSNRNKKYDAKRTNVRNNESTDEPVRPKDDINDSSYYYTDNLLKEQLTSYSLTGFLGLDARFGQYRDSEGNPYDIKGGVPSMMRININPAIETDIHRNTVYGTITSAGIYKIGLKNYILLSAGNAKTTNYQAVDVSMLILALGQVAAYVGWVKRIFGSAFKFNYRNRDLPNVLVGGQRINYTDFRVNMANYRIRFNTILNSLNKLPIPGNIAYIVKWGAMFSNFYLDEYNNDLAQWYILNPSSFWVFNEEKSDTGSGFDTWYLTDNMTMSAVLDQLELMIDKIASSATFNYIFADILRLNEKGGFPTLGFEMLLEGYDAPVLVSEEFNLWVDNLEITNKPLANPSNTSATPNNDVFTNVANGSFKYNPYFTWRNIQSNNLLNFKSGTPDIEKKIAAPRLKSIRLWYNSPDLNHEQGIAASDCYVTGVEIYWKSPLSSVRSWSNTITSNSYSRGYVGTTPDLMFMLYAISQFNYAPKFLIFNDDDLDDCNGAVYGTLDFYTNVDGRVLYEMWDAEWLGLLEMRQ